MISLKRPGGRWEERDFAYYLGEKDGQWWVGLKTWEGRVGELVGYETLEALQREWEID